MKNLAIRRKCSQYYIGKVKNIDLRSTKQLVYIATVWVVENVGSDESEKFNCWFGKLNWICKCNISWNSYNYWYQRFSDAIAVVEELCRSMEFRFFWNKWKNEPMYWKTTVTWYCLIHFRKYFQNYYTASRKHLLFYPLSYPFNLVSKSKLETFTH